MDLLAEKDGYRYYSIRYDPSTSFTSPLGNAPFAALLWDDSGFSDESIRRRLGNELLAQQCRYAVCAGHNCEQWHDAIDMAFINLDLQGVEYDRRFIMTTWHPNESEEDTTTFFVHNTIGLEGDAADHILIYMGND